MSTDIHDEKCMASNFLQNLTEFNPWAEMLTQFINSTNLQQKELAEQIDVSPSTINMWCKGKRLPDSQIVYLLIAALQLSEQQGYLFTKSWLLTKRIRDLLPMLELAIQNKNPEHVKNILSDFIPGLYEQR